jgi:tRNA threonylcarbamoyladenosine biosynthesis protein TsaB
MVNTAGQPEVRGASNSQPQAWLAVETSTRVGSVAVWRDGLAFEQTLAIQGAHSELLLPAIDHALAVTQTAPDEVAAVVVGSGPGSFTGVRIAASLAKGWSMARGTPLYAYSSLLSVAAGCAASGPVCALFDARRGQVYGACYELTTRGATERLAPGVWAIEELLRQLSQRHLAPTFAGEGAIVHSEVIRRLAGDARVLPEHLGIPRASSLLWLRSVAPELGFVPQPELWEPLYVRAWRVPEGQE